MAETTEWVTLVSDDARALRPYVRLSHIASPGHRFILPRSAALGSEFIANALSGDFSEAFSNSITLSEQRAEIVEKIAEYLLYKERYTNSKEQIPDFKDRVKPETALEL
ncbi:SPOSA6832_02598, partial [Sporobolomyces salmonicolor]